MKNRQERVNALHEQDFQQQIDELDNKQEIDKWEAQLGFCRQFAFVLYKKDYVVLSEHERLYRLPLIDNTIFGDGIVDMDLNEFSKAQAAVHRDPPQISVKGTT